MHLSKYRFEIFFTYKCILYTFFLYICIDK